MEESGGRTKSLTVGKPGFGELVKTFSNSLSDSNREGVSHISREQEYS